MFGSYCQLTLKLAICSKNSFSQLKNDVAHCWLTTEHAVHQGGSVVGSLNLGSAKCVLLSIDIHIWCAWKLNLQILQIHRCRKALSHFNAACPLNSHEKSILYTTRILEGHGLIGICHSEDKPALSHVQQHRWIIS